MRATLLLAALAVAFASASVAPAEAKNTSGAGTTKVNKSKAMRNMFLNLKLTEAG